MSKFDRVANLLALIDQAMPDLMELKHRELLLSAQYQITQLRDELDLRKNECDHLATDRNNLALDIEKLRKERDEARREVCCFHHLTGFLSGDYAISRGWDCYKNYSGEGFPQSVTDFKEFLKGQDQLWLDRVDRLTRERDEARQLFCEDRFHNGKHYRSVGEGLVVCASPKEIAEALEWDCFKE